ncbi:MAG: response regulator [Leptospirales bacterium]|nr:response regulator [Leptospirales bacterium]
MSENRVPVKTGTILVVDDSAATRRLIQETLQLAGFDVVLAVDGRNALQTLEAHPEIGLMIADVFMPIMNGLTLVSLVRDSNKTIPIIAISSMSNPDLKQRMLDMGVTSWVSKPLHPVKLLEIVKESMKNG